MENAQNRQPLLVLAEIDPVLAEDAEPDARRQAIAGDAAMTETGKAGDMIENAADEILGRGNVRRGDIVEYIVEITQGARSDN